MFGLWKWIICLGISLNIWLVFTHFQLKVWKKENKSDTMDPNSTLDEKLQESFSERYITGAFDAYLHFFWIFICIYALSKFTELSERYLTAKMALRNGNCNMRTLNKEWDKTLKLYEQDKMQLDTQLQGLREKNAGLEQSMRELRDCNLQLISENFKQTFLQSQQIQGLAELVQQPSNIYITNSHIHYTRQVILNEDDLDIGGSDRAPGGEEMESPDNSYNIWVRYLKMRKCYMGAIADPKLVCKDQDQEQLQPIVVTTEQLARLQGMI